MDHLRNGSKILLLTCALIHSSVLSTTNSWMLYIFDKPIFVDADVIIGAVYLFYPVFGWIADIHITRYRMITISFMLSLLSCVLALLSDIIMLFDNSKMFKMLSFLVIVLAVVFGVGGLGVYEANAVQFALQQLQEAPSDKLSSFIHWYYWNIQLGSLSLYYISIPVILYYRNCKINFNSLIIHVEETSQFDRLLFFYPLAFEMICVSLGLILIIGLANKLDVHQVKLNPFRTIIKILKYTWKHKLPERRSAMTYWENKIPSRIDFGKQKYGGPFTNEEVEDMKTFIRLLVLILSLYGFFINSTSHSLSTQVIRNIGCPKLITFLTIIINSNHIKALVTLLGIPLYHFLLKKFSIGKNLPNLLTRIGIGLVLCLIQQLAYPALGVLINLKKRSLPCDAEVLHHLMERHPSATTVCLFANAHLVKTNGTCGLFCPGMLSDSYLFYIVLISQIIEGFSSMLVFMTVLEFLCAQSPHTMKGLLIGIWYAMLFIRYIGVNILDRFIVESEIESEYSIYIGVKSLFIFISVVLYLIVCKYYRYRERDEVINEQAIIEEQYERELLHETDDDSESIPLLR